MLITKEFLDSNKTAKGGYNRNQLAVFKIHWPAPKGWKRRLIGKEMTEEQELLFKLAGYGRNSSSLKTMLSMIDSATTDELNLMINRINKRLEG